MDLDGLVTLLRDGERAEVLAGLQALTDQDRKKLGPKVRGWITNSMTERIDPTRRDLVGVAVAGGVRQAMFAVTFAHGRDPIFDEDAVTLLEDAEPALVV